MFLNLDQSFGRSGVKRWISREEVQSESRTEITGRTSPQMLGLGRVAVVVVVSLAELSEVLGASIDDPSVPRGVESHNTEAGKREQVSRRLLRQRRGPET